MAVLSAILYFLTHHPFWSWPILIVVGFILAQFLVIWRRRAGWYLLLLPFFLYGPVNIFVAHIFNALFLEAFGVEGSAVVTHSEETSSTLNDQYVWAYDAVLKTADGRDVVTTFDSMSASIYPITNAIVIPPEGERFVVRYVPGFPRNFVIMRDLSTYGIRYKVDEDRAPVDKAAAQLAASPENRAFIAEYRDALIKFITTHRRDAAPAIIDDYTQKLASLPPAK